MSDSDENEEDDYDPEPEPDVDAAKYPTPISTQHDSTTLSNVLKWKPDAGSSLRGTWGAGSKSMKKRQTRKAREFQEQASQCYSIKAMMENGKVIAAKQAQEKA